MQYRMLGATDLKLSALGLGTVKFGRNSKVKYPHDFVIPSETEIQNLLSLSYDLGINFLDTAKAYGDSEQKLGKLLSNRHNWIISTKVGENFINGKSTYCFTKDHIEHSIYHSLKNLKTDYLDIVLVHSNGDDKNIINTGILHDLQILKDKGIIRSFGMSTKTIEGGKLALHSSDVVMITYNLSNLEEQEIIECANKLKKGILIKKGFDSGHLLTKQSKQEIIEKSFELIFKNNAVTSLVIGTINSNHLIQNVSILNQLNTFNII